MKQSFSFAVLLLLAIPDTSAFQGVAHRMSGRSPMTRKAMEDDGKMSLPRMDPFDIVKVDVDHAKDCAEHFGKCSLSEMKQLKEDLHRERLQRIMLGSASTEELFEQRMIEEELSLQLNLLQEEMPPSTLFPDTAEPSSKLFPEVEDPMTELPHLKDGTSSKVAEETMERESELFLFEELAEEGVLESAMICLLIGAVILAPQVVLGI